MKIAHITPGAGGMYCGSCLHDSTLASAMIRRGHDVSLIPVYTPIRNEGPSVSVDRVFYGAVNVYLEQKLPIFRYTPRLLDGLLNSGPVLRWASRRSGSTDATRLGAMTHSMLEGERGHQRKELSRLVAWLRDDLRPDVVHLSNSLLTGMARGIRRALHVPVVCSMQGEDVFFERLEEPWRGRVLEKLGERSRDVDRFVVPCRYYADHMTRLGIPREKIVRVPLGIDLDGFDARDDPEPGAVFVVGYLARIDPDKGLHVLTEAFVELAGRAGADRVELRVAGWLGEKDRAYLRRVLGEVERRGLGGRVRYVGELDRSEKIAFLRSLDVLSVPTTYRDPKGRFVLEALACGVPVVQPAHGAFPELIEETGGGLLVEPQDPSALAGALDSLRSDPNRRRELGRRGRRAVLERYDADTLADATLRVYRECLDGAEIPRPADAGVAPIRENA